MKHLWIPALLLCQLSFAQNLLATKSLNPAWLMEMAVYLEAGSNDVLIYMQGPADRWFANGYGNDEMSGTYAIIVDGNGVVSERRLGDHNSGSALTSEITVEDTQTSGGTRSVWLRRPKTPADGNKFDFASVGNATNLDMIFARGSGSSLSYHGSSRNTTTHTYSDETAVSADVHHMSIQGGTATLTFTNLPPGTFSLRGNDDLAGTNWTEILEIKNYPIGISDLIRTNQQNISITSDVNSLRVEAP